MVTTAAGAHNRPNLFDCYHNSHVDDDDRMNQFLLVDEFQHDVSMCKIASDAEAGPTSLENAYEQDWSRGAVLGASARIRGRTRDKDGVTFYDVEVKAFDREWVVRRRYRDFELLSRSLGGIGGVRPMPPKSIFRHRISTSFNDSRQEQLNEVLRTVCTADPQLCRCPVLHSFLDLDGAGAVATSRPSGDPPPEGSEDEAGDAAVARIEGVLAGRRPRNHSANSDLWQHSYCGADEDSGESAPETFSPKSGASDMSPSRLDARRNSM